jgi:hypothetical protein
MFGSADPRARCVVACTPFADGEMLLKSTRAPWEWSQFLREVAADRDQRVRTGQSRLVRPETIMHFEPASHRRAERYAQDHPTLDELMYPLAETADSIMGYKPAEHVHKISPRSLLVIGAEVDETIPAEHARLLYARARAPRKLVVVRGAGHNDVHNSLLPRIVEIGVAWFAEHLGPRAGDEEASDDGPAPA